ncbi:Nif3-like dinuclear metal center hexameric protein [Actinomyces sp. MRS3W]|uniref:Nif3-like dinuclear metal center hexameric protein n=1 Tax=Actinomyces sp. MRS3W TaxID=2800796 RepID=UPI0028FD941E|nr:Nif3-like dinuclear metal center hexameric protein [Actinomyces sp. MRS3W]MDU0348134.1 Nif3-like dinuclear metal center hexameric protein [Actinomyces sp. MRS3W]
MSQSCPDDAPAPRTASPLTVADVEVMLRTAAPPQLAEPWDSNRLICGDPAAPVRSILLAVDPVGVVVDEAIERGVDLIITHHPLYLRGTDHVSAIDPKGTVVHRLIRAGIALANAHTTLDAAHGGVAAALAARVGLMETRPLQPNPADPTQGIGRIGSLPAPTRLRDFAASVAAALPDSAPGLLVGGDLDASVKTAAVSGGAGDSLLGAAREAGVDVFLTADLRHHPASEHLEGGRPYLLCGTHWATEWVGLPPLAARLEAAATARGHTLFTHVSQVVTDPWALRLSTGSTAAQ